MREVVIRGAGFVMLAPTNGPRFNQWPACWVAYTRRYGVPIGGRNVR
jgi:hypothetical protein